METELNGLQRGKLRWQKLKEADESGKLAMAKNRYEVGNIAGFTDGERKQGYQWVAAKIHKGQIKETIHNLGEHGKMEYEYRLVKDPDYSREKARKLRWKDHEKTTVATPKSVGKTMIWFDESAKIKRYKLEFSRGDTTIRLELDDYNEVIETIKTILKGE